MSSRYLANKKFLKSGKSLSLVFNGKWFSIGYIRRLITQQLDTSAERDREPGIFFLTISTWLAFLVFFLYLKNSLITKNYQGPKIEDIVNLSSMHRVAAILSSTFFLDSHDRFSDAKKLLRIFVNHSQFCVAGKTKYFF